jgi:methylmalonyl-CoA mutase cobalamin-binding domain/chain
VGGIVPPVDQAALIAQGVRAVFGPGTSVIDIARQLVPIAAKASEEGSHGR